VVKQFYQEGVGWFLQKARFDLKEQGQDILHDGIPLGLPTYFSKQIIRRKLPV
jgi:hypothetical protein